MENLIKQDLTKTKVYNPWCGYIIVICTVAALAIGIFYMRKDVCREKVVRIGITNGDTYSVCECLMAQNASCGSGSKLKIANCVDTCIKDFKSKQCDTTK